jgi:parallel beta-helix repeat protein
VSRRLSPPAGTTMALFGRLLGPLLAGYLLFDKAFAYLHLPGLPLFVGDLLLVIGMVGVLTSTGYLRVTLRDEPLLALLAAFVAWGFLRFLPGLKAYGIDAVRDAALWYYCLYAFLVVAALAKSPSLLDRLITQLARLTPWLLCWLPFGVILQPFAAKAPHVPFSSISILTRKPGNAAIAALLCLAGLWLFRKRHSAWSRTTWSILALFVIALAGTQNRGGLLGAIAGAAVWLAFERNRLQMILKAVAIVSVGLTLATLLALKIPVSGLQGRAFTADQLLSNVASMSGSEETGNLSGTVAGRQMLWKRIYQKQVTDGLLVQGSGFGPNLALAVGFRDAGTDRTRNPHNSHLDILARMGLIGFFLWISLWVGWYWRLLVGCRRLAEKAPEDELCGENELSSRRQTAVLCLSATTAILVSSFFDPQLEGPQVAALLWVVFGLGIGVTTRREWFDGAAVAPTGRTRPTPLLASSMVWLSMAWSLSACVGGRPLPPVERPGPTGPVGPVHRSCEGVRVTAADDVQAMIDAQPAGTTFCLTAGTYRLRTPLAPRRGDALIGSLGTVLNGSVVLTGWRQEGDRWSARGVLPAGPSVDGECDKSSPTCTYAEDLFLDHHRLRRVASVAEVTAGTMYTDYVTGRVTIGEDPGSHLIEQAVAPSLVQATVDDVTVANLVLEKAANRSQVGALENRQAAPFVAYEAGTGWRVLNNEVRFNHGVGLGFGSATRVENNYIHDQGQLGFGSWGDNSIVSNNEICANGAAGFSAEWEAGGSKSWSTNNETFTHNYVHDNVGPGIWVDGGSMNTTYAYNKITGNWGAGIQHEISYDATIEHNLISGNGRRHKGWAWDAGIQIQSSGGRHLIEVAHNMVARNANGITVLDSGDRADDNPRPHGPHIVQNVWVHDNTITLSGNELNGVVEDRNDDAVFTTNRVRFQDNIYYLDSLNDPHFSWIEGDVGWIRWRGYGNGNDINGRARLLMKGTP